MLVETQIWTYGRESNGDSQPGIVAVTVDSVFGPTRDRGELRAARVETNSEDVLKQAIDKWAELPGRNETTFDYDEASGQWKGYL